MNKTLRICGNLNFDFYFYKEKKIWKKIKIIDLDKKKSRLFQHVIDYTYFRRFGNFSCKNNLN